MIIKNTKDYLRTEASKIIKMIEGNNQYKEMLEQDLIWLEKCREEINQANALLRSIKSEGDKPK